MLGEPGSTDVVDEIKAFGLSVHHWKTGVKVVANASIDDPTFVGCNFENNDDYGFSLNPNYLEPGTKGVIFNLSLLGCHFEGTEKNIHIGQYGVIL